MARLSSQSQIAKTSEECGERNAHRFVNHSEADVLLLVVGDRSVGDEVTYPDIDMHGRLGDDGRFRFTRKDGTPF